ncbi:MAG: hypothetical protein IT438_14935 [Phycisphaerales bacterium]|nr:hypothetical protein [Phycisphaerales bacterium]
MPSRTDRYAPFLFALLASAGAAYAAVDVCNPALPYTMPDHDQGRAPIFANPGLQNNGSQYCVPTCTTDILTYLQNHGYPNLDIGPGPGPWLGSQAIYNAFTNDIEALASLMSTDPFGGTDGNEAFAGVNQWIDNAGYTGDIVVSKFGMSGSNAPELGDLAFCMIARCPISISVGWYEYQGGTTYVRRGGHCVAPVRLPDFCSPFPKISIRDPATGVGSNQFSQAAGTTETYNATTGFVITRRDPDDNSLIYQGPAVRISGYGANNRTAIIDGYRAFFPAFGLAACNNPVNGSCVTQHFPNTVLTGNSPNTIPLSLPADASVLDLDIAADNLGSWVLMQSDVDGRDFLVWQRGNSPAAEQRFPAMDAFNPRRMCSGREPRVLYFLDANPHLVVRLNTATGVATPMSLADATTAICFDDQHDELVCFSSAARRVTRLDADTLVPVATLTLPSAVAVGPEPRIAICPVGAYLWLTSGINTGYGLVDDPAGALTIAGTISDSQPLRGVDTGDTGHVFTAVGGITAEFEPPAPGPVAVLAWARVGGTPPFAPLADGPIFRIAKSRTNYNRAVHADPSERLNILPEVVAPSVPDCPADFNLTGTVTVQDLFDFLAAYFSGDIAADINESGTITVQDIFDYLAAYFRGC